MRIASLLGIVLAAGAQAQSSQPEKASEQTLSTCLSNYISRLNYHDRSIGYSYFCIDVDAKTEQGQFPLGPSTVCLDLQGYASFQVFPQENLFMNNLYMLTDTDFDDHVDYIELMYREIIHGNKIIYRTMAITDMPENERLVAEGQYQSFLSSAAKNFGCGK